MPIKLISFTKTHNTPAPQCPFYPNSSFHQDSPFHYNNPFHQNNLLNPSSLANPPQTICSSYSFQFNNPIYPNNQFHSKPPFHSNNQWWRFFHFGFQWTTEMFWEISKIPSGFKNMWIISNNLKKITTQFVFLKILKHFWKLQTLNFDDYKFFLELEEFFYEILWKFMSEISSRTRKNVTISGATNKLFHPNKISKKIKKFSLKPLRSLDLV